jgi:hypothetical protein
VQRGMDHACHREPGQERARAPAEPGEPHQARHDSHAEHDKLTIGGNDAEFARVVGACIALNCKALDDRPSGDRLETAALRVAARLPTLYGPSGKPRRRRVSS